MKSSAGGGGASAAAAGPVLPRSGLAHVEAEPQLALCKAKLLPLKTVTLQRLEDMQRAAHLRAHQPTPTPTV